jgi:hypothetical protein
MSREEKIKQVAEELAKNAYCDKHNLIWFFKKGTEWADEHPQKKSMWTKDDEELYQDALDAFEALANDLNPSEDWGKLYDWIKSIKQRMEEQQ